MTGCAGDTAAPPQAVMVILNRSGFGGDALADPRRIQYSHRPGAGWPATPHQRSDLIIPAYQPRPGGPARSPLLAWLAGGCPAAPAIATNFSRALDRTIRALNT